MKLYLLLFISLFTVASSFAQGNIRLTIEWNSSSKRYEVFALSATNQSNYAFGQSQISLVIPGSAPDSKVLVSSHSGGLWSDAKFIAAPRAAALSDFHSIVSNGGIVNLTANQGLLLFSFTFVDGNCHDGVRLYNNGTDPGATASGFNGLNFSNSILGSGNVQVYGSNVSNSGTKCMDCPVDFALPKLKKQSK